jgi:hypothetical protein
LRSTFGRMKAAVRQIDVQLQGNHDATIGLKYTT